MGDRAVDAPGVADAFENLDPDSARVCSFCHPSAGTKTARSASPARIRRSVARLRDDLRELAEQVAAIDRRDAAQHGGLKGEIAHLVRRIARLELSHGRDRRVDRNPAIRLRLGPRCVPGRRPAAPSPRRRTPGGH